MSLRDELVRVSLEWQSRFGVAPSITSAGSEFDAARLVGMLEDEYSAMQQQTADGSVQILSHFLSALRVGNLLVSQFPAASDWQRLKRSMSRYFLVPHLVPET